MTRMLTACLFLCLVTVDASTDGFRSERRSGLRSRLDEGHFTAELRTAMDEILGCGGEVDEAKLASIERFLAPIWQTLPASATGHIERRLLRYVVHRYFEQTSLLVVRGFEPNRPAGSSWENVNVLSKQVPAFVESMLQSRHVQAGFDIHDASRMIATVEQLILDSEASLLTRAYEALRLPVTKLMSTSGMNEVLKAYMVHWMMGDDVTGAAEMMQNRSLLESILPHWEAVTSFVGGEVQAFKRSHQSFKQASARGTDRYTFDDAHKVVEGITKSFGSFWESECSSMKEALFDMDRHHTGRVPLSKFYGHGLDAEWRFAESESYLRELGVLDETSFAKQVIIPNYIIAASNCIISAPHYLVCCQNDCNPIMSEIEAAVRSPVASPSLLTAIVQNISYVSSLDDDRSLKLTSDLRAQLEAIAATHGGQVPIHGRLFAQWLHYVFPRECPFPHKSGAVAASLSPTEFGNFHATQAEMAKQAELGLSQLNDTNDQWMSQWSEEEELKADYSQHLPASRSRGRIAAVMALLLAGLMGVVRFRGKSEAELLPTYSSHKTHQL